MARKSNLEKQVVTVGPDVKGIRFTKEDGIEDIPLGSWIRVDMKNIRPPYARNERGFPICRSISFEDREAIGRLDKFGDGKYWAFAVLGPFESSEIEQDPYGPRITIPINGEKKTFRGWRCYPPEVSLENRRDMLRWDREGKCNYNKDHHVWIDGDWLTLPNVQYETFFSTLDSPRKNGPEPPEFALKATPDKEIVYMIDISEYITVRARNPLIQAIEGENRYARTVHFTGGALRAPIYEVRLAQQTGQLRLGGRDLGQVDWIKPTEDHLSGPAMVRVQGTILFCERLLIQGDRIILINCSGQISCQDTQLHDELIDRGTPIENAFLPMEAI